MNDTQAQRRHMGTSEQQGEMTMSTTGRYSIDFEQSDNPGEWEQHLVMNSDHFPIAENFYFASVDAVAGNALDTILGVRLYDHDLHVAVIEYRHA